MRFPLLVSCTLATLLLPPLLTGAEGPSSAPKADARPGWVLVTPRHSKETILLDATGREAHVWSSSCEAAGAARLHPDGSILRLGRMPLPAPFDKSGLRGGRLQLIDWDGKLQWDFLDAVSDHIAFGDAIRLPNGNVLTAVLEYKSRQECEALGRGTDAVTDAGLYFPGLMEFKPNGKSTGIPVWKWSLADHVFQGRHPSLPQYRYPGEIAGRLDVGLRSHVKGPVWLTPLEMDYHAGEDLILMVMGGTGEVWVIDHATTQAEAATSQGGKRGRGGDLLVRWKGPQPAPGTELRSAVVSAEWQKSSPAQGGLTFTALRFDGVPASSLVEEITLDRETLSVRGSVLVLRDRTAPVAKENAPLLGTLPSAFSRDAATQTVVFTEGLRGHLRMSGPGPGVSAWSHQNERGRVKLMMSRGAPPGQECCGNEGHPEGKSPEATPAAVKPAPRMEELQTAPVGKARLYGAGALQRQP